MRPVFYDLHIHSCLSPCGDDDMTPANIAGMAAIKGLDVIAVTDHNSCRNCPAVMAAADGACLLAFAWCAFSRSVTACGLWALFGFSLAAAVKVWLARPVLCPKEE